MKKIKLKLKKTKPTLVPALYCRVYARTRFLDGSIKRVDLGLAKYYGFYDVFIGNRLYCTMHKVSFIKSTDYSYLSSNNYEVFIPGVDFLYTPEEFKRLYGCTKSELEQRGSDIFDSNGNSSLSE